jgi:hypothetical protein
MASHDLSCDVASHIGQLKVTVACHGEQTIALHASHSLRDRWTALFKPFSNAGTKRHNTFFFEFEDGAQIHFRCINEVAHARILPNFKMPVLMRTP